MLTIPITVIGVFLINAGKDNQLEAAIEGTPRWVKSLYATSAHVSKGVLRITGLLALLDKYATKSQTCHYIRSLFSIYQLDDLIKLDIPWWTYSAVHALQTHLQQLDYLPTIFEYGSGASTIWLAKRSAQIISVEHDKIWFQQLKNYTTDYNNINLIFQPPLPNKGEPQFTSAKIPNVDFKPYVETIISTQQHFDIIVIDGRCREACLKTAIPYLKPNGLIIFDNSNRKRYQQSLQGLGCEIQRFAGRVPGSPFPSETAILKRDI